MSITITRTKVVVPRRRADLLSRPRLTGLLDDLLDYKLLLVAAPAGYGKTSLLLDWAHQNTLPVCWYSLDPLDQDIQRFIGHFVASISRVFPEFGHQSRNIILNTNSTELDLNRVITTIVNDAYDHIKEHFAIVIDDYHTVDVSDEVNNFISRFVDEVDENCHLVISSRTLVSLENLPLMVGRSMVKGLSFEELAFRADEIQALLKQNYQQNISSDVASELEQETEGWITGLLLSAQTMWTGMTDRVRVARASGIKLYDYLAQQVLDQQHPVVRDFLLKSSLLEEFDAGLCEAVFGIAPNETSWFELIGEVLQNNLFVLPVDSKGTWLRYHHLFRDFLQAKIRQENPDAVEPILRRLAEVYKKQSGWEEAYEIYQTIGDNDEIIYLVEQAGTPLIKSGQLGLLRKWLSAIPLNELNSNPGLLSLNGTLDFILGNMNQAMSQLDRAESAFRAENNLPQLAKVLIRRASCSRLLGDYAKSLVDIDEASSIVKDDDSLGTFKAEAFRVHGLCLQNMGQLTKAINVLEKALYSYDSLGDSSNKALTQSDLGGAYLSAGLIDEALTNYEYALEYWRQTGNITRLAYLLNSLGVFYHLKGEYDQAGIMLNEALTLARKSGSSRFEAYSLASLGDIYVDLDYYDAARDAYQRAYDIGIRIDDRFLLLYINLANVNLNVMTGDLEQADDYLNSSKKYVESGDSDYELGLHYLSSGRILIKKIESLRATQALKQAIDRFEKGGQQTELIHSKVAISRAYHDLGEYEKCEAYLGEVLQLSTNDTNAHALVIAGRNSKDFLDRISSPPDLLRKVNRLRKQIDIFERKIPEYRRLLRQQGSLKAFSHHPKMTINVLGTMLVSLNGEPVTIPEWSNQKAVRELFFLLLANPDGLTKEVIGGIIWPNSSPKQLKMQFKNALYRLRRALGKDVIVFAEDDVSYQFNQSLDYEYDVETFKRSIENGDIATDLRKRIIEYQNAFGVYKGNYLPDVDGTWVIIEREELFQRFIGVGIKLARFALDNLEYQSAIQYCREVLTQDPCQEEAHRLAMQAYAGIGNRSDLVRQFEICKDVLNIELGVSPSPQTEALYERLMM